MITERITRSFLGQKWNELFVELLIVIVGVFLAIQVDNWNDTRKELAQERLLLESLRDDFIENQKIGEHRLAQYAKAETAALELSRLAKKGSSADAETFYSLLKDANSVWPPSFMSSTWDLLTADGQMTVIQNASIKKEIATFYDNASGFDYFFDGVTLIRREIERHIIDHYGIDRWLYHLHPVSLERPEFDEEDIVVFTTASRQELNNLSMRAWHAAFDFRLNLERITENAGKIQERIAVELGRFD